MTNQPNKAVAYAAAERLRFEEVLEAIPSAVVLVEASTRRLSYINQRARALHGVDFLDVEITEHVERVRARHLDGAPFPLEEMPVSITLSTGLPARDVPIMMERADGLQIPVLVSSAPVCDADGHLLRVIVVFDDITQRWQAEEALRESEEKTRGLVEQLLESDRRKDEFLAMLGHELRNPLAAIRHAAEIMKQIAAEDSLLQRAQGALERQSAHMARLIDSLLEVSRIARGKIRLDPEILDVRELVDTAVQDRQVELTSRRLSLRSQLPLAPVWVNADRVRLAQVVDNLIGNAIKFTEAGNNIRVRLEVVADRAFLRVSDDGVGIRPEMLSSLFEPFFQESQELARSSGGLGLGLAVAKGLVELHGGSIEAQSEGLGKGAEFRVHLPLTAAPMTPARPVVAQAGTRQILVVEDNMDAGQLLHDLLELLGHTVEVVDSGPEALAVLAQRRIDVVFCDLGLPGMSGFDIVRAIRSEPAFALTPVVALTGYGQPEDQRKTKEAGFDLHLVKPAGRDTLNAVLASLPQR